MLFSRRLICLFVGMIQERAALCQEILRKHPGETSEEEVARIRRQHERIQYLYERINSMGEEKQKVAEKLFLMQENFIRKLDQ